MGKKREGLSVAREVRAGGGGEGGGWARAVLGCARLCCVWLQDLSLLHPRGVDGGWKIKSLQVREGEACVSVLIS